MTITKEPPDIAKAIEIIPQVEIKEPINDNIKIDNLKDFSLLRLGNTGISIQTDHGYDSTLIFTPEGKAGPTEDKWRPAIIFGYGLYGLYTWAQNEDPAKFIEPKAAGNTNLVFAKYLEKLFARHQGQNLLEVTQEPHNPYICVKIDLLTILRLPENNPLIEYLKVLHKKGEGMTITRKVDKPTTS